MKHPSVSKILDATMSPDKRAALDAWVERVGAEEAERIRSEAIARGNKIDECVDVFRCTGTCDDARIVAHLTGYEFVAHEMPVVSDMHKYQGRLDAVLRMNGRNILVDFKGSGKWKPKRYLEDYRMQLGAYYGALLEMGYEIDCACVVLFIDGRDAPQLYWQQKHELDEAHTLFVDKARKYHEMNQTTHAE